MISPSAKWHIQRRKEIIAAHPEVKGIKKYNPYALITIILIPVIHFSCAYASQYLSILEIFFLAWFVGGLCVFAQFNNSHEICHGLVHPKIKGRLREWLLHFASLPSIAAGTYTLFRWGHLPHHSLLGTESFDEAKNFLTAEAPDIELLTDVYYYELTHHSDENPKPLLPFVFKHRPLRLFFTVVVFPVVLPFMDAVLVPITMLFAYFKGFFVEQSKNYRKKVHSILIQLILVWSLMIILFLIAGPLAILYLFLSGVSGRGLFFHPGLLFAISTHKTWGDKNNFQPTTSTYGWLPTLVLMKINYHVEHHDFPDIPRRYLPQLKKLAPEFYDNLASFKGISGVFKTYYNSPHWFYAGVFEKTQAPEEDKEKADIAWDRQQ